MTQGQMENSKLFELIGQKIRTDLDSIRHWKHTFEFVNGCRLCDAEQTYQMMMEDYYEDLRSGN